MDRTDRVDQIERLDIVVKGRHKEVSDRFREHVRDKLTRLERLDPKAYRIDVEVSHENNPRLAGSCDRVELTLRSKGPVVRAEAAAQDCYAALDVAAGKLEERLRRAADRRRTKHPHGHGASKVIPGVPVDDLALTTLPAPGPSPVTVTSNGAPAANRLVEDPPEEAVLLASGPLVVREKSHDSTPISLDDALHRMELVGHDFYLYCDTDTGLPSVVYRRRGYTYGVLRLRTSAE